MKNQISSTTPAACDPVSTACDPVSTACDPVSTACDPVSTACDPIRMGAVLASLALFASLLCGCRTTWTPAVDEALAKAGKNRSALEAVLDHYSGDADRLKLEAALFLIGNMDGHGYTVTALYDEEKDLIPFDALDYKNFGEAQAALDALEKEHGPLDFKLERFDDDLETITSEFLIENIDYAFRAWRERPWARELSFEAFCEWVLPYRCSNEPLNSWRPACMEEYDDLADRMDDRGDIKEAGGKISGHVHSWMGFSTLYYLHPTDQGFDEMKRRRLGRCEDISNMISYALRANAIPCAADYTPYWANRDNNHAWEVLLDSDGRGRAGLSNRAAKIYRKCFSIQKENLGCIKTDDEEVPRWLSRTSYQDVTGQYLETTDVTVALEEAHPDGHRFAYICVFNGGEWKAIDWGWIRDGSVTFAGMGRGIAFLPAYFVDKEIVPAARPFILEADGTVRLLGADRGRSSKEVAIEIAAVAPVTPDADTRRDKPMVVVKPGKTYELFVWNKGWQSLGKKEAGNDPVSFDAAPAGRLFWLVEEKSRRLERIFTIEEGNQIWW